MNKPSDYVAIAVWARELGNSEERIAELQQEAAQANAPTDVVFRYVTRNQQDWFRVKDFAPSHWWHQVYAAKTSTVAYVLAKRDRKNGRIRRENYSVVVGFNVSQRDEIEADLRRIVAQNHLGWRLQSFAILGSAAPEANRPRLARTQRRA